MKKGDVAKAASGKWIFWLDDLGIETSREFDAEDDAKAAAKVFLEAAADSAEAEKAAVEAEKTAKAEQDAEWARLQRNFNAMKARSEWQRG